MSDYDNYLRIITGQPRWTENKDEMTEEEIDQAVENMNAAAEDKAVEDE